MSELFDIENFFLRKSNNEVQCNQYVYERLCKKIDVVKRVYKFYSADLSTKKSDYEINSDAYLVILTKLISNNELDFKFINTALKLNDILLSKNIINDMDHKKNQSILVNKMRSFFDRDKR